MRTAESKTGKAAGARMGAMPRKAVAGRVKAAGKIPDKTGVMK